MAKQKAKKKTAAAKMSKGMHKMPNGMMMDDVDMKKKMGKKKMPSGMGMM